MRLTASDGELTASDEVTIAVNPANQAPTVNVGPDRIATLPAAVTLDATVTDDGLPSPPAMVTTLWSMESGPGTVTFGNSAAVDTTASFSTPGTYVLRLTASDSGMSEFDDLTVTVNAANQAPIANAGPDQAITLPAAATLDAHGDRRRAAESARDGDDPLVDGQRARRRQLRECDRRRYDGELLRRGHLCPPLDGERQRSDRRRRGHDHRQRRESGAVVNAGPDLAIILPAIATLDATVTDDGLPNPPATVTTAWTQVSGPGTVTFGSARRRRHDRELLNGRNVCAATDRERQLAQCIGRADRHRESGESGADGECGRRSDDHVAGGRHPRRHGRR